MPKVMEQAVLCYHCGQECAIGPAGIIRAEVGGEEHTFCCHGCMTACRIIIESGEGLYYRNRTDLPSNVLLTGQEDPDESQRAQKKAAAFDLASVVDQYTEPLNRNLRRLTLMIKGIHCQSCVFLNERMLSRLSGVQEVSVDYDSGRATLIFDPGRVRISSILNLLRSIGYEGVPLRPGQKSNQLRTEGRSLLWKIAIAAFAAGNVMLVSAALWAGYFDGSMSGELKHLLHWFEFLLTTPVFLYSARVFHRGWRGFLLGGLPNMDVLISAGISAAYFYSVYVFFSGEGEVYFDSVNTIVFLLLVGRYIEWRARLRQRERMEALVRPLPAHCERVIGDINDPRPNTMTVAVRDVVPGDVLLLQSGDTIPADGLMIAAPLLTHPENEGDVARYDSDAQGPLSETCEVDESVLTGESRAVERKAGDRLLAGSVVVRGAVLLRVTSAPAESSLAALSRLAEGAGHGSSDYERLTRRIIPAFSMIVLLAAVLAFGFHYYIGAAGLDRSLIIAISVLIISCPCALALAVPTATGAAIYLGLRRGVLIRDGNVLQRMTNVHRFFFDKTGTLTEGRPCVTDARFFYDHLEVLRHVARIEKGSVHPLGQALLEYARSEWQRSRQTESFFAHVDPHHDARIVAGKGVQMEIQLTDATEPVALRLGSVRFIQEQVTDAEALDAIAQFRAASPTGTVLGLSIQNRLLALFALNDVSRPDARQAVTMLTAEFSALPPVMMTGDDREVARHIGQDLGFVDANIESGLLPNEKIARIATEREAHPEQTIAMVGDGYNDAPALAAASLALVMARGAPLSLEHAGVILLNNRPMDIVGALRLARRALRVVRINFGISFFYNAIMIPLAMAGYLLPIWCALAMASSSLLVIASSSMFRLWGTRRDFNGES